MKLPIRNWLLLSSIAVLSLDSSRGPTFAAAADSKLRGRAPTNEHRRILERDTTGTFLIADIQYEDGFASDSTRSRNLQGASSGNRPERTYNVELPDGHVYELKNLPPAFSFDGLVSGSSSITLPSGTELFSNGQADVRGVAPVVLGEIFDRKLQDLKTTKEQDEARATLQRQLQEGNKSVLAVRVVVSDGAPGYNEDFLSDSVFGTSGDPMNLASQYTACSHGKLNFGKAGDRTQNGVSISNGVVTISLPNNKVADGDGTLREAATTALSNTFGTASGLANYVMFCLPEGSMSGIAYAYINSWRSVYKNYWCTYPSAQMHELGHNLGYAHSNEGSTTYADQSGMMGYSYSSDDGPKMCFNGAKSSQTGWYADKEKIIDAASATNSCFQGELHGIVDYLTASTVLLRFVDDSFQFHVNFNAQKGFNSGTREAGNQVTVTRRSVGSGYAESTLVAKLGASGSFSTTNYRLDVTSINTTDGVAQVTLKPSTSTACVLTSAPTNLPTTAPPTRSPTEAPTNEPTISFSPSSSPSTSAPTKSPTPFPTSAPTQFTCSSLDGNKNACQNAGCNYSNKNKTCTGTGSPPTVNPPSPSPPSPSPPSPPTGGQCDDCSIFTSGKDCGSCGNCSWSGKNKACS